MSLNIMNTNVSTLFGTGNNQNNSSLDMSNVLSEYASIKNGSFARLAKQYYSDGKKPSKDISGKFSDETNTTIKENKSMISDAGSLRSAISALSSDDKLFTEKIKKKDENGKEAETLDYDKIYKKVSKFVDSYNAMIKSGGDSDDTTVLRNTLNMTKTTQRSMSMLQDAGFTINADNTLSIDEDDLKAGDMQSLKSLFGTSSVYSKSIDAFATNIASQSAQNVYSLGGYNSDGAYKQALNGIYNTTV